MAEVAERVANLEGRFDAQTQELSRIHKSVVRVEDKMDRGFESVGATIGRLEDKVERRFEGVDVAFGRLEDKFENRFAATDSAFQALRSDFRTDFRWVMGGIAGAALAVILAMFAKDWL